MSAKDRTLIIVKPDGVERRLVGEVLHRFEQAGLTLDALDLRWPDRALVQQHYAEHRDKQFYDNLVTYLTDAPVVSAVFSGPDAVSTARRCVGHTNPSEADPDTIRGDLGEDSMAQADREDRALRNVVHASDSLSAAAAEIELWFGE